MMRARCHRSADHSPCAATDRRAYKGTSTAVCKAADDRTRSGSCQRRACCSLFRGSTTRGHQSQSRNEYNTSHGFISWVHLHPLANNEHSVQTMCRLFLNDWERLQRSMSNSGVDGLYVLEAVRQAWPSDYLGADRPPVPSLAGLLSIVDRITNDGTCHAMTPASATAELRA